MAMFWQDPLSEGFQDRLGKFEPEGSAAWEVLGHWGHLCEKVNQTSRINHIEPEEAYHGLVCHIEGL
jgi:hypothetical protein